MKIYTNEEEYNNTLRYWSNAAGDLFDASDKSIDEDELPKELLPLYKYLSESDGMYMHLAQYNGKYGFALVNEYYEYLPDSLEKGLNNYHRAVEVAKDIEVKFPQHTVIIGNQLGYPNTLPDGTTDKATELVVFIDAGFFTGENDDEFRKLVDYLNENAYIESAEG